jgi:hypothetical protein
LNTTFAVLGPGGFGWGSSSPPFLHPTEEKITRAIESFKIVFIFRGVED